jgi:hypothetical protein
MISEHVVKAEQPRCQQTISVALIIYVCQRGVYSNGPIDWGRLQMANKFSLLTHSSEVAASVCFFGVVSCCIKRGDQQEDLARSGYKTNKEVESLGILLHVARTTRISIYEGRSFVLFCIVVMRSTKLGCFRLCSTCLWKALSQEGCMGLVP